MKLIPALEKNIQLVEYSKTNSGRALIVLVFTAGLFVSGIQFWCFIGSALMLYEFLPKYKKWILLSSSLLYTALYTNFQLLQNLAKKLQSTVPVNSFLYRLMLCAVTLLCCFLILRTKKKTWPFNSKSSVWLVFLVFNLLVISAASIEVGPDIAVLIWSVVFIFGHYYWFLAYGLQDRIYSDREFKFFDLGLVRPIWTGPSIIPRQSGFDLLTNSKATDATGLKVLQLKAIKLILWSLVLKYLGDIIFYIMFGKFEWLPFQPNFPSLGVERSNLSLEQINRMDFQVWQAWIFMICTYTLYLLKLTYWGNIMVAVGRMCGFPLKRVAHRPLEARTLAEYFRSIHFYYYELIKNLFFFPLLGVIKLKSRKSRLFLATFLAIFFGGGIQVHIFSHPNIFIGATIHELFLRWLPAGIYHLIFGALLATSFVLEESNNSATAKRSFRGTRFFIVFVFYIWALSWLITWGPEWPIPQFSDQLKFSGRLLGVEW